MREKECGYAAKGIYQLPRGSGSSRRYLTARSLKDERPRRRIHARMRGPALGRHTHRSEHYDPGHRSGSGPDKDRSARRHDAGCVVLLRIPGRGRGG